MALSATVLIGFSLITTDQRDTGHEVTLHVDREAGIYYLQGMTRSSPIVQGRIRDVGSSDIDGDGFNDRVVVDDRDTATGHGIGVVYDVSTQDPYAFWACPLQTPDLAEAVETCRQEYSELSVQRSINGLQYLHDATREEGMIDWETQHIAIPNWTHRITSTLTRQNVEVAQRELGVALASGADPSTALDALQSALLLREQHTNLHPTGE